MDRPRLLRNLANVANLSTPLGLAVAVAGRARLRRRGHLIVADRARLPIRNAGAVTIGSVVLVPHRAVEEVEASTPTLMEHEDGHAWQYAYCLGLPFIPLYGAATLWSMIRTGGPRERQPLRGAGGPAQRWLPEAPDDAARPGPAAPGGSAGTKDLTSLSRGAVARTGPPAAARASGATS